MSNIGFILIIDLNVYCLSYDEAIRKCNGGADNEDIEHCCSEENPCNEGEGDCDISRDCKGDLVCGTNNCDPGKYSQEWVDCCKKGLLLNRFYHNSYKSITIQTLIDF